MEYGFFSYTCLANFFLLLPKKLKSNKLILFSILIASLVLSYLAKNYLINSSQFFSIIIYFPFFIMAYFINNENISSLRKNLFDNCNHYNFSYSYTLS